MVGAAARHRGSPRPRPLLTAAPRLQRLVRLRLPGLAGLGTATCASASGDGSAPTIVRRVAFDIGSGMLKMGVADFHPASPSDKTLTLTVEHALPPALTAAVVGLKGDLEAKDNTTGGFRQRIRIIWPLLFLRRFPHIQVNFERYVLNIAANCTEIRSRDGRFDGHNASHARGGSGAPAS